MKKTYIYSLLQYRHSIVLGEVLNMGLLVYFSYENQICFIHPKSFERIKSVYYNFPEHTITSYFDYFDKRVSELNAKPEIFLKYEIKRNLKALIENEFLSTDSSILQFSNHNKAISYAEDLNVLVLNLYGFYFPWDNLQFRNETNLINKKNRKKEDWIKPDFKNKIVKVDKDFIFLPSKNELSF